MNEIAEDSSISKGNIYYYFPDKNALITEVIKDLLNQFDKLVQKRIANCTSTLDALEQIQFAKNDFFEKHYMLHIFESVDCSSGNENTRHLSELTSNYAVNLLVSIFKTGIERGEFKLFNIEETAELYIQASKGIFLVNKDQSIKKITIDEQL